MHVYFRFHTVFHFVYAYIWYILCLKCFRVCFILFVDFNMFDSEHVKCFAIMLILLRLYSLSIVVYRSELHYIDVDKQEYRQML